MVKGVGCKVWGVGLNAGPAPTATPQRDGHPIFFLLLLLRASTAIFQIAEGGRQREVEGGFAFCNKESNSTS